MRPHVLYEIPVAIAEVASRMLSNKDENHYFRFTVDGMRFRKLNGEHINNKLIEASFGDNGRKRIIACFKECVALGLMHCNDRYRAASPGTFGVAKFYQIAPRLLVQQDVATEDVTEDESGTQHSDGLPSSCGGGVAIKSPPQPIARCVHANYTRVATEDYKKLRARLEASMRRLGWDCCKLDVTSELEASLKALNCDVTNADVIAYCHSKTYKARRSSKRRRFHRETGQYEVVHQAQLSADELRELEIGKIICNLANLRAGRVSATRKNGRCYHNATDIPTQFRRISTYTMPDGTIEPAVDVDVSAMWWWELSTMIRPVEEHYGERMLLRGLFETGTFYEHLRDRMLIFGAHLTDQERIDLGAFKKAVNAFILFQAPSRYSKKMKRGSFWMAFREAFPALSTVLSLRHEYDTLRQLNFKLSRIEGSYTLDYVMKELHRRNVPALPYHDGMLVPESAVDLCISLYRRRMIDLTGHAPLIRAKGQAVTSDALEIMMVDDYWGTDDDWEEDHPAFQEES